MSLLTLDRWRTRDDDDIDPRIAARRSEVREQRRRRFRRWLLALAVVATVAAAGWLVAHSGVADVDQVTVAGATRTSPDDVVAATGIRVGEPLVSVDLATAEQRVAELPWVKDAQVDRDWRSGDIAVTVTERTPVATVRSGDQWLLVDADRRVVAALAGSPPELVVLDGVAPVAVGSTLGDDAAGPLAVASALTPGLRSRVSAVRSVPGGELELAVRPAGTVRFGPAAEVPEKVRSLQTVFSQVDLRCLRTVDIRVADAPVLTREPACT